MYIRQRDYDRIIQSAELQQYINADTGIQTLAYLTGLAKIKSKLKQKFYTDWEFTDTLPWKNLTSYTGNNRVELNFTLYAMTNTYNVGATCSDVNGNQYVCLSNGTTGTFNPSYWQQIGSLYDLWYIALPYPLFDVNYKYSVGSTVFWKGNIYIAQQSTVNATTDDQLQDPFNNINQSQWPFQQNTNLNVYPDDPTNGVKAWGVPIPYNITGIAPNMPLSTYTAYNALTTYAVGSLVSYNNVLYICTGAGTGQTPGTNALYWSPIIWTYGDNRDQLCVAILTALVIYDITPRIVTDEYIAVRERDLNRAEAMLTALAMGDINEDKLVLIENNENITTYSGGVTKNINVW